MVFFVASKDTCCASEDQNEDPRLAGYNYLAKIDNYFYPLSFIYFC